MEKIMRNVEGMSCSHCVNAVKKAVGAIDGVGAVTVDLEGGTVTVEYDGARVSPDRIKSGIEEQGYDVLN